MQPAAARGDQASVDVLISLEAYGPTAYVCNLYGFAPRPPFVDTVTSRRTYLISVRGTHTVRTVPLSHLCTYVRTKIVSIRVGSDFN